MLCCALQVALIVYMAHIGSFVPARSAVIGLTDRILTRLPGMESVVQHTSSFMSDLAQVGVCFWVALEHCWPLAQWELMWHGDVWC